MQHLRLIGILEEETESREKKSSEERMKKKFQGLKF